MQLQYSNQKKEESTNEKLALLRLKEEEDLAQILSQRYNIPYIDLTGITIDVNALKLISEEDAKLGRLAGFVLSDKKLSVAVASPNKDETKNILQNLENRGYSITVYICSTLGLEHAWSRYKDISFASESKSGILEISNKEIESFITQVRSLDDAKKLITDIMSQGRAFRISRIVEIVVACAYASKSSDIHVEPEETGVRLRFRLDGVLQEIIFFDEETYKLLLSRIKLLSGLKLNVKKEAQDGRFSVKIGESEVEIRTSVLPGNNGETIVMRLLDPKSLKVPIEALGISPRLLKVILEFVDKPDGMILNTGPTGSGKTTALYAFLNRKKSPEIKIITIEDPIEYHLPGIVQTQVDRAKNYDFANGLRSSLRQDPDVMMVGEIRDGETAETAIHASLTGHLVFSTLHTNNAAGAFPRLIDMGINPKIITSALKLVIAQRLVRKLCNDCKKQVQLEGETFDLIKNIFESVHEKEGVTFDGKVYESVGCEKCNMTGYKGRIGIFEAVITNKEIEDMVQDNPSEREIKAIAEKSGYNDMAQDAVMKILAGITSIDESRRVVDLQKREGL